MPAKPQTNMRETLTLTATELVQRGGLNNLSFRTLAEHVGIKSSSVHYHFPNKAQLAAEMIKSYGTHFSQQVDKIRREGGSLEHQLHQYVGLFETVLADNKFCMCGMLAAEIDSLNEESRGALRDYFARIESELVGLITAEKEPSDSRQPINAEFLAKVIISGLEGALLIDRIHSPQTEPVNLDAQRQLVTLLLNNSPTS